MGGKVQAGSGSSQFAKGDFRNVGHIRGECKFTRKPVYILKEDDLKKIQLEALKGGFEDWVMQVEFVGAGGQSKKFAVADCKMFMEMWTTGPFSGQFLGTPIQSSQICQVGKSYRFSANEFIMQTRGIHIAELMFIEGKDVVHPRAKIYSIVPWQVYLDVRKAYMEREQ